MRENKDVKRDRDIKKNRTEKNLKAYTRELNKNYIKNLTQEEIENFIKENYKSGNRLGFYNQISILNDILIEKGSKIVINSKSLVNECVIADDSKYFLKAEILDICNALTNTQDKFIIYALFNGIMGKNCEDLLSIKTTDVSKDCSYIKVNGHIYFLDDILKEYVKDLLKDEVYIREVPNSNAEYIERLNTSCPYLIKPVPNKRTNDGLDMMTRNNLNGRLQKLNKLLLEEGYDVRLAPKSLYFSGIMFKMFEKEIDENVEWTVEGLDDWLKMNDYQINSIELYRKYYNKYHGANSLNEL